MHNHRGKNGLMIRSYTYYQQTTPKYLNIDGSNETGEVVFCNITMEKVLDALGIDKLED